MAEFIDNDEELMKNLCFCCELLPYFAIKASFGTSRHISIAEVIHVQRKIINVSGMNCYSCRGRIEKKLSRQPGVHHVKVDFYREIVIVDYDPTFCSIQDVQNAIKAAGYSIKHAAIARSPIYGLVVAALLLLFFLGITSIYSPSALPQDAAYFTLFVVGLLSSLHCVGMCGGIALAQNKSNWLRSEWQSTLLYNLGRILSYTLLGGIIGAAGSVLDLPPVVMAAITILAGLVTLLMGTNMLGISLAHRLFSLFPSARFKYRPQSPFLIGLLNGLMPCGPLQAMQVYSLGMGSFAAGALAMFSFALGTVPMMVGLGVFMQRLSSCYTGRLFRLSAVIIIILGLSMVSRGLTLGGIETVSFTSPPILQDKAGSLEAPPESKETIPFIAPPIAQNKVRSSETSEPKTNSPDNVILLVADRRGFSPLTLHAVKNQPVKIVITAKELNGCNSIFMIPSLNIKRTLVAGENAITLPPQNKDLVFSCGMGMIKGKILFTETSVR